MEGVISFTKTKLPYGWLGNMSPYPIEFDEKEWRTSEALFQALRFRDEAIQELIRAEKSPMGAKAIMNENVNKIIVKKHSDKDLANMKLCLRLKLDQHPSLKQYLLDTGDLPIIEDVTARGDVGGNLFWGAMLVEHEDGFHWVGNNALGKMWMEIQKLKKDE